MFRSILMISLLSSVGYAHADRSAWQDISNTQARSATSSVLTSYRALQLDKDTLRTQLSNATAVTPALIELPLPEGGFVKLYAKRTQVLSDALAQQHPDIQTWSVESLDTPKMSGVIDLSAYGFHAMLMRSNGERIFIDPDSTSLSSATNSQRHVSFDRTTNASAFNQNWSCGTHTEMRSFTDMGKTLSASNAALAKPEENNANTVAARAGEDLRTYRIAVAATTEYVNVHAGGSTAIALSKITSAINRINQIYQRDLSIRLQLVSGTTVLGNYNYTNSKAATMMAQNQTNLDNIIGSANYDIGHVFGTEGGGIATVASACTTGKARGVTGLPNTFTGDAFDIDYFAHEVGHQFSASHTFNSTQLVCSGGRINANAVEPGSGNTIMGYAGLCGSDNLQTNSLAMFHSKSIEQITQFAHNGTGNTCGTSSTLSNTNPSVNAGTDYTIPAYTAFTLSALSNADANGDTLSYSWEQIDAGTASAINVDTGNNALIRVAGLSNSASRTIPQMSNLINGSFTSGEIAPVTTRTLNFRLQARDNKGGIAHDDIRINVHNTGSAFEITVPSATATLNANTMQPVQWNVANTTQAPINCSAVDIALTTDGGNTFTTLTANTPNDGSENVVLPATLGSANYIRVKCSNNIFFALSSGKPSTSGLTTTSSTSDDNSGGGGGGGGSLPILLLTALAGLLTFRFKFRLKQLLSQG